MPAGSFHGGAHLQSRESLFFFLPVNIAQLARDGFCCLCNPWWDHKASMKWAAISGTQSAHCPLYPEKGELHLNACRGKVAGEQDRMDLVRGRGWSIVTF